MLGIHVTSIRLITTIENQSLISPFLILFSVINNAVPTATQSIVVKHAQERDGRLPPGENRNGKEPKGHSHM